MGYSIANIIDRGIYKEKGSLRFNESHKYGNKQSIKCLKKSSSDKIKDYEYHFHSGIYFNWEKYIDTSEHEYGKIKRSNNNRCVIGKFMFNNDVHITKQDINIKNNIKIHSNKYDNEKDDNEENDSEDEEDNDELTNEIHEELKTSISEKDYKLDDMLNEYFKTLEDHNKFTLLDIEEKGLLGLQRRMRPLRGHRYDCPICGKEKADQDNIIGFAQKDGKIYTARRCFHDLRKVIMGGEGIELNKELQKKLKDQHKERQNNKIINQVIKGKCNFLPLSENTADLVIDSKYINNKFKFDTIDKNVDQPGKYINGKMYNSVLIQSEPGTGKTQVIRSFIEKNEPSIVIANRQSYALHIYKELKDMGFVNYMDVKSDILKNNPPDRLIISIESLYKLNMDKINHGTIICDESEAILGVLRSKTLFKSVKNQAYNEGNSSGQNTTEIYYNRAAKSIKNFISLLTNCNQSIFLDGFKSRKTYDFCKLIYGRDNMFLLYNKYKSMKFHTVDYLHINALEAKIFEYLRPTNRKNIAIAVCQKLQGDNIADRIISTYPDLKDKILIIDKTDTKNEKTEILLDNDRLKKYTVIIYTPKIINGVSITITDHFHSMFLFADRNSCCTRDICQMLKRVRYLTSKELHMFCPNIINPSFSLSYSAVYNDLLHRHSSCISLAKISHLPHIGTLDPSIISAIANTTLEYNFSQAAPKQCLFLYLDFLGSNITINQDDSDRVEISKERSDLILEQKKEKLAMTTDTILSHMSVSDEQKNILTENIKKKLFNKQHFYNLKYLKYYNNYYNVPQPLQPLFKNLDLTMDLQTYTYLNNNPSIRRNLLNSLKDNDTINLSDLRRFNSELHHHLVHQRFYSSDSSIKKSFILTLNDSIFHLIYSRILHITKLYNSCDLEDSAVHFGIHKVFSSLNLSLDFDSVKFDRELFGCYSQSLFNKLYNLSPKSFRINSKTRRYLPVYSSSATPKQKIVLLEYLLLYLYGYLVELYQDNLQLDSIIVGNPLYSLKSSLPGVPLMSVIILPTILPFNSSSSHQNKATITASFD